jgi:hypothetical protein
MKWIRIAVAGLVTILSSFCCGAAVYKVAPHESVLFLGGLNTVTGHTNPNGFINIFEREVQSTAANVTIFHGGFNGADGEDLVRKVDTILGNHLRPSKAILTLGVEILAVESAQQLRFQVESIVARLLVDKVQVVLCPLTIDGERIDVTTELDDMMFELIQMSKQIARDYDVMYVNLQPQLETYWARNNLDKLEHSVLTLDGRTLNELGHNLVALALLKALGVEHKALQLDNVLLREQLRISEVSNEIARLEKLDQVIVDAADK